MGSVRAVHPELRKYWPAPTLSVNFCVQQIDTADFGPIRIIPRHKQVDDAPGQKPPLHLDEEEEMKHSVVFPLPVGAAILRDHRLWHSGSPNLMNETRFLPCFDLCSQGYADRSRWRDWRPLLCPAVYAKLSARSQQACEYICAGASSDIPRGIRPDFHCVQATYLKGSGRKFADAFWPASRFMTDN